MPVLDAARRTQAGLCSAADAFIAIEAQAPAWEVMETFTSLLDRYTGGGTSRARGELRQRYGV